MSDDVVDVGNTQMVSKPLVYDDTMSMSSIQRVLFVSNGASSLETYANATTFTIVYDYSSSLEDILEVMRRKFSGESKLSRIGFAFHNHGDLTEFCNRETWFTDSDVDENQPVVFSRNVQFIFDLLREFKQVTHVDFLACKTLQSEKWRKYYQLVQAQTGVVIGASDDDTGNVKYGGDWVMESTMEDIREVYFTGEIENYASLLAYGDVNLSYLNTMGTASTTCFALALDGDILYVGVGKVINRYNLLTKEKIGTVHTSGVNISYLCLYQGVLYYPENVSGQYGIGRISISADDIGTVQKNWVIGNANQLGLIGVGEYLYYAANYLYKIPISYSGGSLNSDSIVTAKYYYRLSGIPTLYNLTQTRHICSDGIDLFVSCYDQFVRIPLSTFYFASEDNIINGNKYSCIAIKGYRVYAGLYGQVRQWNNNISPTTNFLVGTINATEGIDINGIVVYNDTLLCSHKSNYIASVDITITKITPTITERPRAKAFITYPAMIGTVDLSGGKATEIGGTDVTGTFIISTDISTNIFNAGTYTNNISATFLPTDTSSYTSAFTFVQSVRVLPATPVITETPTGKVVYPNKLRNVDFSGGQCFDVVGGSRLSGTFTIHPDLSNSVFDPSPYTYDVSAVFTPTSSNYGPVVTKVPLTVQKGSPVISVKPDATVVYPKTLAEAIFSGGVSLDMSSGGSTLFGGTYSIHPDFSNSVIEYGQSFSDISAVYTPADLTLFNTITTKLRTSTVYKGTPFITENPTATIVFPEQLRHVVFSGGECRDTIGGSILTGSFTIHPDLSNSVYPVEPNQDVSAVFTPLFSLHPNYEPVVTKIPLTVLKGTPFLNARPTATIVYPKTLGDVSFNGGSYRTISGGSLLSGRFTIHPDLSNSTKNAGTHYDISAVFTPNDLDNYVTATTTINPLNVSKGTPFLNASPTATIVYPNKLIDVSFSGGSYRTISGGSLLSGRFTIHPDLSNSTKNAGTHYDISAVFTPNDLDNYVTATTTIDPLNVSQGTPYIYVKPTASVVYPNNLGSAVFTSGTALDISGGSDLSGTFTIHPNQSNFLRTIDTYFDISAVFTPFSTNFVSVVTTITPLTVSVGTPIVTETPTATIVYPKKWSQLDFSGGKCFDMIGGSELLGTFTIHPGLSNSFRDRGTYSDISAVFTPSSNNFGPVATKIQTVTVSPGMPYISVKPNATALFPKKLSTATITGGAALGMSGGSSLAGTFSIHPDLSNSLKVVGQYQDVSAIFTPTPSSTSENYNPVTATTIQTLTVTAINLSLLKSLDLEVSYLREIGYSASDLKTAGYDATELKIAYNATELKTALFTATQLKTALFSAIQLKTALYTASELKTGGYSATELKTALFTATELKTGRYSASELKTALFSATELKTALYTAGDLKTGGYSATDLKTALFTASELKAALFSATDLKTALFTASELKTALFFASELKSASFPASDLKTGGYSASELKTALFSASDLKTGGYSASELKTALFSATELKTVGYSAGDLKTALYFAAELRTALYTAAELNTGGYLSTELRSAGFTALQLRTGNYSLFDLKTAGYTVTDLKNANYAATELLNPPGLYVLSDLKSAEYEGELKTAGYNPFQLISAGFSTDRLYQVFTTVLETKSVTKAHVSYLLPAAQGKIFNVALNQLRGYSFTPSVKYGVAVKVTNPDIPITVSRSEMMNGSAAIYAILDVPLCSMVFPTWTSSVQVKNIGNDTYNIYDSDGTTVLHENLVSGNTITEDGLTIVIGSVTATLAPIDIVTTKPVRQPFFINSYTNGGAFSMNRTLYTKTLETAINKEEATNKQFYGKKNRDASSVIHRRKMLNLGRTQNTTTHAVEKVEPNDVRQAKQRVRNSGYVVPPSTNNVL